MIYYFLRERVCLFQEAEISVWMDGVVCVCVGGGGFWVAHMRTVQIWGNLPSGPAKFKA